MNTPQKIKKILDDANIDYKYTEHEEAKTSEDSARARGEDLKIGAKAMVLKCDDKLFLFVLSASKKIDSNKVKKLLHCKSVRFADEKELFNATGCIPGGVAPFGNVFNLDFFVDKSVFENEEMAFNCGERTKSIKMKTEDYKRVLNPKIEDFSKNE